MIRVMNPLSQFGSHRHLDFLDLAQVILRPGDNAVSKSLTTIESEPITALS